MTTQVTLPPNFENNCIELSNWDINDKVSFNFNNSPSLGVVVGFSYNSSGELLVNVREFNRTLEGYVLQLHPHNTHINLTNLTRERKATA